MFTPKMLILARAVCIFCFRSLPGALEEGGSGAGIFENRSRGSFWANDRLYVVPGYVFRVILALLGPGGGRPGDF